MKRTVVLFIISAAAMLAVWTHPVSADTKINYEFSDKTMVPQVVLDVDNYQYPSTDRFYIAGGMHDSAKFVLETPSVVKAYYTWDYVSGTKVKGNVWFSYSEDGVDVIGKNVSLSSAPTSATIFLDPGTYYINHMIDIDAGTYGQDCVGIRLLVQPVTTDEELNVSSFMSPNPLVPNRDTVGFLSNNSPYDCYCFTLEHYSRVDFSYNFQTEGGSDVSKGLFALYDGNRRKMTEKGFDRKSSAQNSVSIYLDAGVYYVEMSGAACPTFLRADVTDYLVEASYPADITNGTVSVTFRQEFEPVEILVKKGSVSDRRITDKSIWAASDVINATDGGTADIADNGTYTARIKDLDGRYVLCRFEVSCIDKTAPEMTADGSSKDGKKYSGKVTVTATDPNLNKLTVNGAKNTLTTSERKKGSKSVTCEKAGEYTIVATDKAGNSTEITFTIGK